MSVPSRDLTVAIPKPGTRRWWVLYLFTPVVLGGLTLLAFPTLVYDRFVWQYLWGPVVADAAGQPVTHDGIRAVRGYNAVNTATYLAAVAYSLPGIRTYLAHLGVEFDARLAYGLAPIVVAGGAMRALEDLGLLADYAVWFITPSVYVVVAAVTVLALGLGAVARDRGVASIPWTVAAVGTVWAAGAVGRALWYGVTTSTTLRLWVPVATVGIALGGTGLYYWVAGRVEGRPLRHPLLLFAVFGQLWDGAQNLVGVTFLEYAPKLVLTHFAYQATGFTGSTFVLKLLVTGAIVWYLADAKAEMGHTWWWLVVVFIGAIGLPMGVRGSLRMMLGV